LKEISEINTHDKWDLRQGTVLFLTNHCKTQNNSHLYKKKITIKRGTFVHEEVFFHTFVNYY